MILNTNHYYNFQHLIFVFFRMLIPQQYGILGNGTPALSRAPAEQKHRVRCVHKAQQTLQALSKDFCSDWLLQPVGKCAKREEQQLPVLSRLSKDKHTNQSVVENEDNGANDNDL